MPTTVQVPESAAISTTPVEPSHQLFRFAAADFLQMVERDVFPDSARLELWDGLIFEQMAKGQAHSVAAILVGQALWRVMPQEWCLSPESPVDLGPDKIPLPDFVVLRGAARDYLHRVPTPRDAGLIVELADSSLRFDTTEKLAAYARAGVPTYWVVNLVANVVQVYDNPVVAEGRYASEQTFGPGSLIPLTLEGVAVGPIAASDVLPQV